MIYHSFIPSQQKKCQYKFLQTMDIQVLYVWFADTWHFLVLLCFFMTHLWFAETDLLLLITWLNEVHHSRALLPSSCWVILAIISWLNQPAYRPISFGCAKHKVQHYNSRLLKSNLKWHYMFTPHFYLCHNKAVQKHLNGYFCVLRSLLELVWNYLWG